MRADDLTHRNKALYYVTVSDLSQSAVRYSPLVERAMNVWACLWIMWASHVFRSIGSLTKMCCRKSWGVTAAMSHFSLDRTNSSHLWNRTTFSRIHPTSGTEQHSIERIQLLEQNIQSNASNFWNRTTFNRTHPASGTEQHSIEHIRLLEQNNIQSNTSDFWNRTFNRTHPTSGTQHPFPHPLPPQHLWYLRNYTLSRSRRPESQPSPKLASALQPSYRFDTEAWNVENSEREFTFHVLTAFPVTPTPIHCETYRLTIRFRCICATCKSFLQMSRLQYWLMRGDSWLLFPVLCE